MDIKDIAKHAGVSTATVSRVVHHAPTVAPELARRVWSAIDKLGYYPNTQARALVSGRSNTFGLIVSEITNPFFPEIVQSFENAAVAQGYEIMLTSTAHDPRRMELAARRMIERRVDGVAVMSFGMEESLLTDSPFLRDTPLVFVDVGPARERVANLRIDYAQGIGEAVEHLRALGHERIAFIAGPQQLPSAQMRRAAFLAEIKRAGGAVDDSLLMVGDHTIEGGMAATRELLKMRPRPTAVLCSNDMTAIGVMHECHEQSVPIPEELSVVGYDDIRLARYMLPPLTTVRMSQRELGETAFRALYDEARRTKPRTTGRVYPIETHLELRRSTAPPKKTSRKTAKKKG